MKKSLKIIEQFKWLDLDDQSSYHLWREAKLKVAEESLILQPVEIRDLSSPSKAEMEELSLRCSVANFAIYTCDKTEPANARGALRDLASALGLEIAEKHHSAESDGIVLLQPSEAESKRRYIPYTNRAMSWHTDGYYNAANDRISAMLLHCGRPASDGGKNQFLDPEIVYIRLRDTDPDLITALLNEEVMTIPANTEPDRPMRAVSTGPVFYPDPGTGRLQMRYTARTRSVIWQDDPLSRQAEAQLRQILTEPDALTYTGKLEAGQGVLCNNVLHNRTAFSLDSSQQSDRLYYRVRFHNRVKWSPPWPN